MVFKKRRLTVAITVYWILLAYILTGLGWWLIALERDNRKMTSYEIRELRAGDPNFSTKYNAIIAGEKKRTAGNIGEGTTYFALIVLGAIFVYREVRRQMRLQQQQQNFMMAVTHELKTPIAVTKLNLETLLKHRLDEQKQQKMITAALQETDRLDHLATNILIASQLEGGGYPQSREILDLSGLIQHTLQDYRHRFPERHWEERVEAGVAFFGDALLLQLLVSNLVENAIKYSPREGVITVSLERRGRALWLSVADQGQGIADAEKKKIFDKFYRSGLETTRKTKGTGLGLYLCREIAEEHEATLKVADNSPVGSIFTVVFQLQA